MSDIPKAVWEGELKIGNLTMKVYVLDDGRRVIAEESIIEFFDGLENGTIILTEASAEEIAKFIKDAD